MKRKLVGITALLLVFVAAAALTPRAVKRESGRVHQHLTARKDTGCDCGGAQLCSHLPLVVIDTGGQEIPGEVLEGESDRFGQSVYRTAEDGASTISVEVSVIDNQDRNNHPDDEADFTTACEFRIRGNSSRRFSKRPYALRFVDGAGESRNISVMGMGAHHDWALHGPILDKSLIRNYMWYNIAGEVMEYAPNVRFCELVLDGQYEGLYLMEETITDGDDCRLKLNMKVKNSSATGYLLRCDRPTEVDLETERDIYTYSERVSRVYQDFAIRYPGKARLTEEMAKDIELDYSAFEKALYSYDYDTEKYGYWNWIDVDNFVDYYLIHEFTRNVDAGSYSTYLYKEVGEPFRLCVWDFNNACDNYQEEELPPEGFSLVKQGWFLMLFKDEEFVERVIERYGELRASYLSYDYLMSYIDGTLDYLGPAVQRNNERWAAEITEWEGLQPAERNPHSHEKAVEQLKDWLAERGDWMDWAVHTLRQYAHPSRNKVYNH